LIRPGRTIKGDYKVTGTVSRFAFAIRIFRKL
jgi:hypothetical protein